MNEMVETPSRIRKERDFERLPSGTPVDVYRGQTRTFSSGKTSVPSDKGGQVIQTKNQETHWMLNKVNR